MAKNFNVSPTELDGLYTVEYRMFADERGDLMEFYRQSDFECSDLPSLGKRPQINAPLTKRGAIRGIHAETTHKLVSVGFGRVFAAIVDLRYESETFGVWQGFELDRGQGLFVSSGLGNSFQTISNEPSLYLYQFSEEWQPGMPGISCHPLDNELDIKWPIRGEDLIVSEKDRNNPPLTALRFWGEAGRIATKGSAE